jgi:RNA polymerase sigma-70 factor (ECF subfamily)
MDFKIYRAKEDDLIKGCRKGDRHAQQQIFDLYASRMLGVCLRYVKNTMQAEDILVVAFTKVFDRIGQFKGEGSFEGWIRRIAVNEALTWLRRSRAMMVAHADLVEVDRHPDYNHLADHLEAEDLLKMIDQLPPGYRIVFNMYAIDGYSHKEISAQLGISENTSKSQLSRARVHLQKLLAETELGTTHKGNSHESTTR